MWLDETDIEVALSDDGFNVPIQTDASQADSAAVYYSDPRAVSNVTDIADGFIAPAATNCAV